MLLVAIAGSLALATPSAQPRAAVAGGGIGGLCTALVLQKQGYHVSVFEKTKQYRPFGGPIQIASNGLSALASIDPEVGRGRSPNPFSLGNVHCPTAPGARAHSERRVPHRCRC